MGLLSPPSALAPEKPSSTPLGPLPNEPIDDSNSRHHHTPPTPVWSRRARRPSSRVSPPSSLPVDSFLPFFLSYKYYCLPQRYRYVPGFLRHRVLASVPEYNPVDPNLYTRRLQDIHFHERSFRPPPCRDLRGKRSVVSLPRQGPRQSLRTLLFLSVTSLGARHLPRASSRITFLPQFRTPPPGYFCPQDAGRSIGGGKRPFRGWETLSLL